MWKAHRTRCLLWTLLCLFLLAGLSSLRLPGAAHAEGPRPGGVIKAGRTRLTRGQMGELGEHNMQRYFSRNAALELQQAAVHHSVYQHGIDAIYRDMKANSYHIVEAKATSDTGRIGIGILARRSGGERQMDDRWIRTKLDEALAQAARVLNDDAATAAQKKSARALEQMVLTIQRRRTAVSHRTLVITRYKGVDSSLGNQTVSDSLFDVVDQVIELDATGRVICVYPKRGGVCSP